MAGYSCIEKRAFGISQRKSLDIYCDVCSLQLLTWCRSIVRSKTSEIYKATNGNYFTFIIVVFSLLSKPKYFLYTLSDFIAYFFLAMSLQDIGSNGFQQIPFLIIHEFPWLLGKDGGMLYHCLLRVFGLRVLVLKWLPPKARDHSRLCYLTNKQEQKKWIHALSKEICMKVNTTDSSKIWTLLSNSTFHANKWYATYAYMDG